MKHLSVDLAPIARFEPASMVLAEATRPINHVVSRFSRAHIVTVTISP